MDSTTYSNPYDYDAVRFCSCIEPNYGMAHFHDNPHVISFELSFLLHGYGSGHQHILVRAMRRVHKRPSKIPSQRQPQNVQLRLLLLYR